MICATNENIKNTEDTILPPLGPLASFIDVYVGPPGALWLNQTTGAQARPVLVTPHNVERRGGGCCSVKPG